MIGIICAAPDTPEKLKVRADYLCDARDARPVLQAAIDEAYELNVNCVLLPGTYTIDSRSPRSENGAICFWNPEVLAPANRNIGMGSFKASDPKSPGHRNHVLEGVKTPYGYKDGASIVMTEALYRSLSDDDPFSLFFADGGSRAGRGVVLRNLSVRLPGNQKPVIVFDGSTTAYLRYEDLWATTYAHLPVIHAFGTGIPVPHPGCVGFRGSAGSNSCTVEWKNCQVCGFGVGFDIGGEHVYCESLSAWHNGYGFRFDCYKGKEHFDDPMDAPPKGVVMYPITCVNLLDEHSIHLPRFGNVSHGGCTPSYWGHQIRVLGMNIQWPNCCPGHIERHAPDFMVGRHRAVEDQPGSWFGTIEYVMDHTTDGAGCNLVSEPFFEEGSGINVRSVNLHEKP